MLSWSLPITLKAQKTTSIDGNCLSLKNKMGGGFENVKDILKTFEHLTGQLFIELKLMAHSILFAAIR